MKNKNIPMLDLTKNYFKNRQKILNAIDEVLSSGQCILGPKVYEFESKIANYLKVNHAIGVNSGTDALKIALKALDFKKGDEIITTPFTFIATAETIIEIGATPVFVDIRLDDFNIDPTLIPSKITSKTKAILVVHLFGLPCRMNEISKICEKYSLFLIEDVAQAFGAKYDNKFVGQFGDIACYSFYPTKNLFTYGDGGLITTNNDNLNSICRLLRNHGIKQNYEGDFFGYNSRLDSIHAAILLAHLPLITKWNNSRRKIAQIYNDNLKNIPDIITPKEINNTTHVYSVYTIRVLNNKRDYIKQALHSRNIMSNIYYPKPLHLTKPFSFLKYKSGDFPNAELASTQVLSLPIYPNMPIQHIKLICNTIKDALK
jgi:dTDP-4-amino-4,6-dideoxygalactose transaminase